MKNKYIKFIIVGFAFLLSVIAFPFSSKNVVLADEYTGISSAENFAQIKDNITGNYVLNEDITLSSEQAVNVFRGTLDGKGHTISVNGLFPIFNSLDGANLNNLKINFIAPEEELPTLTNNFGLLAGQMSASVINTVECDFTIKEDETTLGNTESLTTLQGVNLNVQGSYNIGGLIGKSSGGEIKNCVVFSKLNVKELDATASFINLGGLVGYSENTNIHNVIINSDTNLSHNENSYNTKLSNGGIIGYLTGNQTKLKNVVVDGNITGNTGANLGAFVGALADNSAQLPNIQNNQIKGLVSTLTGEIEGFGKNNYFTKDTHYKLSQKKANYQKIDVYNSTEFWDNESSNIWDTDSVWKEGIKTFESGETDNRYLILLQCFETFVVQVDNSSNTHSLTSYPSENILNLTISVDDNNVDDNYVEMGYGKDLKITASFNTILNNEEEILNVNNEPIKYDVFFEIVSLRLENKKLTDVEFDETTLTWTIPFMKYSYEGTYTVELVKKTYNLLATTVTPDGDIQGKISGSRSSSVNYSELSYQFSYGTTITFYSIAERYFASAGFDFYPSKDKDEGTGKEFDYENVKTVTLDTCNESMFTFQFVENDLFTINYLFKNADLSNQNQVVGYINSLFSNNVCELYFEFELDGELSDEMFGMKIYVAGEQLAKTNGVLVKKVIRGNDVTISLTGFPYEEYKFVTIRDDFGNEYLIDGETTFEFNSGNVETVVFTLSIETLDDGEVNSSIWWIIGGIAAGILAIVVCWILIVKFRDNSYRNMYNKF